MWRAQCSQMRLIDRDAVADADEADPTCWSRKVKSGWIKSG